MKYIDKLYGKINIEEPIILELINSPSLQRLKGIDQTGYPKPFWPGKITRFDHSLGVYILLRKFGANLTEQIAGLIHDISHTVFSHCGDYALKSGSEIHHNLQDNLFEKFLKQSEISSILKRYHFAFGDFLNRKGFSLLEKPLPDLCADRIDYFLRDMVIRGKLKKKKAKAFLSEFIIIQNKWVFKNFNFAKEFALFWVKMNNLYYAGPKSAVMFRTTGDVLKYALEKKYIFEKDFFTTDKKVLIKIRKHKNKDKILNKLLNRMEEKTKWKINKRNYSTHIFCKSRAVDPLFLVDGRTKRVSEADKNFVKIIKKELKPKEYYIKFEN